jgi:NAD(P)-dependent dehydrogenase (short-subunit alcohol dehydrogenase family)
LAFGRQQFQLIVSGRREDAGHSLISELKALGAEAEFVQADVRKEADVKKLVDVALQRFGRIDVAVNNAGVEGALGSVGEQTVENYYATFDTNVLGVLLSMKYELPVMIAQGSGSIINLSSMVGKVGMAGASVYVASKHAVEGLTKSAALEAAQANVRVNAVAPGPIETAMLDRFTGGSAEAKAGFFGMIPNKRGGRVEEIASTIVFLASDQASYLTGQSISVDGGYTAQ